MRKFLFMFLCFMLIPCMLPLVVAEEVVSEEDDDGEWEEIVIRRRVKKKKPQEAPAQPAPVQQAIEKPSVDALPQPPPPPEPPLTDAAEPRRLVRYFCRAWKDEDFERLWWAMTPEYRQKTTLKKFTKLFKDDKEMKGGLIDENIVMEDVKLPNGNIQVTVDLTYKFRNVGVRRVKAVVEKKGGIYRMCDSGIIPLDMDNL